ncbi:MAG: hypothetical protein ACOYOA_12830 [Saprospiraceae bacterium]
MKKTTLILLLFISIFYSSALAQDILKSFNAVYIPCFSEVAASQTCASIYNPVDKSYTCKDGTIVEDCQLCAEIAELQCKFIDEDLLERVKPPKGKDCTVFKVNGKVNMLKALPDFSQFEGKTNPNNECSMEAFFARERITFDPRAKKLMGEKVFYTEKGNESTAVYFYFPKATVKDAKLRFRIKSEKYQLSIVQSKFEMKSLRHVPKR